MYVALELQRKGLFTAHERFTAKRKITLCCPFSYPLIFRCRIFAVAQFFGSPIFRCPFFHLPFLPLPLLPFTTWTELDLANSVVNSRVYCNTRVQNSLSTNRPSFDAANQVVTLTFATNERVVTRRVTGSTCCRSVQVRSGQVRSVQFVCCKPRLSPGSHGSVPPGNYSGSSRLRRVITRWPRRVRVKVRVHSHSGGTDLVNN